MRVSAAFTIAIGLLLLWVLATGNYKRALDAVNVLIGAKDAK